MLLETGATTALFVVVAAVAVAFALPWLPRPDPAGAELERYQPLKDGAAALFAKLDEQGVILSWTSQNRARTPWLGLYGEVRKAPSEHLFGLYGVPDLVQVSFTDQLRRNEARGQILLTRLRELTPAGQVTETTLISLRDERGELLVSVYTPADGDLLLDPPILTLSADLQPGLTWQGEGLLGTQSYRWSAEVAEAGNLESRAGSFDDCLRVESRLILTRGTTPVRDTATTDWYCAEMGLVESSERDLGTGRTIRTVRSSPAGGPAVVELQPPGAASGAPAPGSATPAGLAEGDGQDAPVTPGDLDDWVMTRVGRGRTAADAGESSIPPLYVPGNPPLLLVAGYAGDLLALEAGEELGAIRWRFHPPGTIYGPPTYDSASGRIYFGAGDRRLYALDTRGLFLWSFETGDNVATRPLVIASDAGAATVVFGSEDGTVYGLDGRSGQERWRAAADGPVVASPVWIESVVAIGSDDGTVRALDPATGAERWQYQAGGPIEAPLVTGEDGRLYVASRDGTVAAVEPSGCAESCQAAWETKLGGLLRQAPAVGQGRVLIVDDEGYLTALEAENGRRLWSLPQPGFVGTPVLVGEALIVARKDGEVVRLDLDGTERERWSSARASGLVDAPPQLAYGPIPGGGALWLADDGAVIRRLGPPDPPGSAMPLRVTTMIRATQPPFNGSLLFNTPVAYQDAVVVVDPTGNVHLIDPAAGRGVRLATLGADTLVWPTDPIVAGDTLLVTVGTDLYAVDLSSGQTRWTFAGEGTSLRPPTVADDTVLWLTASASSGASAEVGGPGTLRALGLADGQVRWQAPLSGQAAVGGAVIQGGTALVSTPPSAYDLASGALRWRAEPAEVGGLALGGPALGPDGATLFVGLLDAVTGAGRVVALDAASGQVRWRADLGTATLRGTERLWLDGDTLIVPTMTGAVLGLDAASGRERWQYRPPSPRLGSVTVGDGRVWLVLETAQVIGLDTETGRPALRFRDLNVSLNGQGFNQRPAIVDGRLVVAIGRMLLGFALP